MNQRALLLFPIFSCHPMGGFIGYVTGETLTCARGSYGAAGLHGTRAPLRASSCCSRPLFVGSARRLCFGNPGSLSFQPTPVELPFA
jgi:hypothetical protein